MPQGIKHKQRKNNSYSVSAINKICIFGRACSAHVHSFRAVWACQRAFSWEEKLGTGRLHKGKVTSTWDYSCVHMWRGGGKV